MKRQLVLPVCLVAVAGLIGCEPRPSDFEPPVAHTKIKNSEEAANIYVAAYPAVPWSDISDKLEPKNNLTTEQARTMAAQTTQAQIAQFLSTFAAGLGIGLPVATSTGGTTTRGIGAVPSSSGAATTAIGDTALTPDLTKGPLSFGVDGNTLLTAGTALYQQAQILDNQISKGVLPDGYQAHLITLQVNLQPKQRSVSYDAYTDVTLLPSTWSEAIAASEEVNTDPGALPSVMVHPLIIMDALETTDIGRSVEAMRQASLALSGTIGVVGVSASASGGVDRLASIAGKDKNGLVTVGRVSDHTVRIRLGASNSGSAGLALFPRSYNVSLVVLTRWDPANGTKRVTSLQATTHTTLVSTEDGSVLDSGLTRRRTTLAQKVKSTLDTFQLNVSTSGCAAFTPQNTPLNDTSKRAKPDNSSMTFADIEAHLDLLRAVDRGDFKHVKKCLDLKDTPSTQEVIKLHRVLAALAELQNDSRFATLHITLRRQADPTLPDINQIALYSDDTKQTNVALRGGRGLSAKQLRAALLVQNVPPKPDPTGAAPPPAPLPSNARLLPISISLTDEGSQVSIAFPSLSAAGLTPVLGTPGALLFTIDGKSLDQATFADISSARYWTKIVPAPEKSTPNPVNASSNVLVADQYGLARLTLQVGTFPDPKAFPGPLALTAAGADLRTEVGTAAISAKGVALKESSMITLLLGNLSPANLVILTTTDSKDKPIGKPITLTVDRAVATAK